MVEEDKTEQVEEQQEEPKPTMVQQAEDAAKRLEEANAKQEELLARQEALMAKQALGGITNAGKGEEKKEELTDKDYAKGILDGSIKPDVEKE